MNSEIEEIIAKAQEEQTPKRMDAIINRFNKGFFVKNAYWYHIEKGNETRALTLAELEDIDILLKKDKLKYNKFSRIYTLA